MNNEIIKQKLEEVEKLHKSIYKRDESLNQKTAIPSWFCEDDGQLFYEDDTPFYYEWQEDYVKNPSQEDFKKSLSEILIKKGETIRNENILKQEESLKEIGERKKMLEEDILSKNNKELNPEKKEYSFFDKFTNFNSFLKKIYITTGIAATNQTLILFGFPPIGRILYDLTNVGVNLTGNFLSSTFTYCLTNPERSLIIGTFTYKAGPYILKMANQHATKAFLKYKEECKQKGDEVFLLDKALELLSYISDKIVNTFFKLW